MGDNVRRLVRWRRRSDFYPSFSIVGTAVAETELAEAVAGVHPLVSAQATQVQQESWQHIDPVLGNAVFPFWILSYSQLWLPTVTLLRGTLFFFFCLSSCSNTLATNVYIKFPLFEGCLGASVH